MEKFRKEHVCDLYSLLHVYECPISLLQAAMELSEGSATVENLRPNERCEWFPLDMQLFPGGDIAPRTVRWVSLDVVLSREVFRQCLPFWDRNGVYAIFAKSGPIKFRSCDLEGVARYRALKNLNWSLELAIPGASSDGWGHIASPDPQIIDLLFTKAASLYDEWDRCDG